MRDERTANPEEEEEQEEDDENEELPTEQPDPREIERVIMDCEPEEKDD